MIIKGISIAKCLLSCNISARFTRKHLISTAVKTFSCKKAAQVRRAISTDGASWSESRTEKVPILAKSDESLVDLHGNWPDEEKLAFFKDMTIYPDFLTNEEEEKLMEELEPYLKRLHYEFDHWDDAIHGYRETERKNWYPHNRCIIQRVGDFAFEGEILPYVHVLDLSENGVIKPHVDSTRFCGPTIAGLSLLSDAVMKLVRIDEKKYLQNSDENGDSNYRNQPDSKDGSKDIDSFYADILLKRRSLYVMSNSARYNFTHEILGNDNSKFRECPVHKGRRISIICRNEP